MDLFDKCSNLVVLCLCCIGFVTVSSILSVVIHPVVGILVTLGSIVCMARVIIRLYTGGY